MMHPTWVMQGESNEFCFELKLTLICRNYMAQDIMRRILRDYFGYQVQFVMNITDVDDKIILRARQQYLLKNYLSSNTSLNTNLLTEVQQAWAAHFRKTLSSAIASSSSEQSYENAMTDWDQIEEKAKDLKWVEEQKLRDEKFGMHFSAVKSGLEGLKVAERTLKSGEAGAEEAKTLIVTNTDAISLWLDKKVSSHFICDVSR